MIRRLFFTILLFTSLTFSQNNYDPDQFIDEGVDYFSAPFKWEAKDFLFFGLSIGATYGAMQLDNTMKDFTQTGRAENSSIPILAGRFYGEPVTPFVLSAFFFINGNSNGNNFQKKLGFEIAQASFYAVATVQIIKSLVGRERPVNTDDNSNYNLINLFDDDFFSLPSGHTAIAFALSTVLSDNSKLDVLKVLSFLPAIVTAYSRIYENRHWLSDVVLGGIIGYATAKFFVNKHETKNFNEFIAPQEIFSFSFPLN